MWKNSWDFIGCFLHGSSDGTFKYFNPEKLLQHFVQLNGLSPVWFPSRFFTWCGKAPVIFGALQWLFPSCLGSWEALATLYAIEWLLSSVIPFMLLVLYIQKTAVTMIWLSKQGVRGARFTSYDTNPVINRIWTGKREIWDHLGHLEVLRIPKSHNTCGLLKKPGRSIGSKLLDSLL